MYVYSYSQCAPERVVHQGNTISVVSCRKRFKYNLRRHFLKNEFFYGTVLWFLIIFTLAEAYLQRVGF